MKRITYLPQIKNSVARSIILLPFSFKFYSNEKIREDVIYELTHNNKDKKNELNLLVENKVNKS